MYKRDKREREKERNYSDVVALKDISNDLDSGYPDTSFEPLGIKTIYAKMISRRSDTPLIDPNTPVFLIGSHRVRDRMFGNRIAFS